MIRISFSENAWVDYVNWQSQDKKVLKKINALLKDISRHPFEGEGKPEKLKGMDDVWSRRINNRDRLTNKVTDDCIFLLQCRGHYGDK